MMTENIAGAADFDCREMDLDEFCELDAAGKWLRRGHAQRVEFLVFNGWVALRSRSGECAAVSVAGPSQSLAA